MEHNNFYLLKQFLSSLRRENATKKAKKVLKTQKTINF